MRLYLFAFLFFVLATPAGAQSLAFVEQVGSLNATVLLQSSVGGGGNEARIQQQGMGGNVALLEQDGGAYAAVLQRGNGNVLAGFDALGNGDALASALSFEASRLMLNQIGNGNQAFIQQGAGAVAQVTQNGNANTVIVRQNAGGSFP